MTRKPEVRPMRRLSHTVAFAMALGALLGACATAPSPGLQRTVQLPLINGWFAGRPVVYVTTDVSDAGIARDKGANYAPRLVDALPPLPRHPGQPSAVDKVYAVTNFVQGSVFASAPDPMGHANRSAAYSPLWQLVTVAWQPGRAPRALKSEEEVLAAAESGEVTLDEKRVVLNCPIVLRDGQGALPGVSAAPH